MTKKSSLLIILSCLILSLCLVSVSFGEQPPAPGTVIDKNNIDQFASFFPPEMIDGFKTGWGVVEPMVVEIGPDSQYTTLKAEIPVNEANQKAHIGLTSEEYPDMDLEKRVGQPFWGVTPADQNFTIKMMWNKFYAYFSPYDTMEPPAGAFIIGRRRGETRISVDAIEADMTNWVGRLIQPPTLVPTRHHYQSGGLNRLVYPAVSRNVMTLGFTMIDPSKERITYAYVPALRRVVRNEASAKSTPASNSTQAPDDIGIFGGRIPEFTYKYLGDKKVIAPLNHKYVEYTLNECEAMTRLPIPRDGWRMKDCYMFEVYSKDPNYPQSKKVLYMLKEYPLNVYGMAFDRAGELWKVWFQTFAKDMRLSTGEKVTGYMGILGVDTQLGYATIANFPEYLEYKDKHIKTEEDYSPKSLRDLAR